MYIFNCIFVLGARSRRSMPLTDKNSLVKKFARKTRKTTFDEYFISGGGGRSIIKVECSERNAKYRQQRIQYFPILGMNV